MLLFMLPLVLVLMLGFTCVDVYYDDVYDRVDVVVACVVVVVVIVVLLLSLSLMCCC